MSRELATLKSANYVLNFNRISAIESWLNDASEKFVPDRIGNLIKTDLLNSEKMTPRFLKLVEVQSKTNLNVI